MRLPDILTRAIVNLHDADERYTALQDSTVVVRDLSIGQIAAFDSALMDMDRAQRAVLAAARLCAPAIVAAHEEAERRRRDTIAEDHADEAAEMRRTA